MSARRDPPNTDGEDFPSAPTRIGLGALLPGWTDLRAGRRHRGGITLSWYATALLVGLCCWGTPVGTLLLVWAWLVHVRSIGGVIRGRAYPPFPRGACLLSSGVGLSCAVYGPAMAGLCLYAWPTSSGEDGSPTYLVDRTAFRRERPEPGAWVWIAGERGGFSLAQVLARDAVRLEFDGEGLAVDGKRLSPPALASPARHALAIRQRIPDGWLLVRRFEVSPGSLSDDRPGDPALIRDARVLGEVWAVALPSWSRGTRGPWAIPSRIARP